MADLVQCRSRRKMEQRKRREETESEKGLDETQFVCELLYFLLFVFIIFVDYKWNVLHSRKIVNFFDKFKSGFAFILTCVRHFVKCHANESRE